MALTSNVESRGLLALLQLEALARSARTAKELEFIIVNETRRLLPYEQAVFFSRTRASPPKYRVETVASVAVLERNAPYVVWFESTLIDITASAKVGEAVRVTPDTLDTQDVEGWTEFSFPHGLSCLFGNADGVAIGGLWLAREAPWQNSELALVERLAEAYAHAWCALVGPSGTLRPRVRRPLAYLGVVVLLGALLVPVRLSTLAPAEIVARDPIVVSAPMDGVIAELLVAPSTETRVGDVLFTYEDTNLRNQHEVSERALAVRLAEYNKASQSAFLDADSKARVALLKAQVELGIAERDYAVELLGQVEVKADQAGVVLYSNRNDWIGRPVAVGERIMEIADPEQIELRIELAVKDAITLKLGAPVRLFLDADPLNPMDAVISHFSHRASVTDTEVLAYRVTASLLEPGVPVRLGAQGTAKIYGDKVALGFYLFRRPLSALRQFIGF